MVSIDFFNLDSFPGGIKMRRPFSKSLLSFKKKNIMNKTEKRPMLKLPKSPTNEFKKLGINPKLILDRTEDSFRLSCRATLSIPK